MTAREIAGMFEQLELELITSLKRNLARHKAWEKDEGFEWEAWQAAKLRELRRFRRENQAIVDGKASIIETESSRMILEQAREGGSDGFFSINDRKVKALLDEMQNIQQKTEKAALRYMDDVYRRTVHRAALGMATGSMTLQQATDAATRDFLAAGINCIEYKDGRRVNIASYAEMALRTASTRAMLLGEAQRREAMGIDTVLVSQYGGCSDTCLPWQGLVYIDDVWQDYHGPHTPGVTYGVSRSGRQYPLLSVAVKAGLLHPNCRHHLTTWIEGVSRRPAPMDKAKIEAASRLEAKQRELERKVRRAKREAEGLQDPDAVKAAKGRVRAAQKELREFVAQHGDALRRDYWRERALPEAQRSADIVYHGRTFRVYQPAPERVPLLQWEGISEEQAQNLQKAHKQLLEVVAGNDPAREAGGYIDNRFRLMDGQLGSEGKVRLSRVPEDAVGLAHTHPTGETFSLQDVSNFTIEPALRIMTAVGNKGNVYVLEKLENYDVGGVYHLLQEKRRRLPDFEMDAESYVQFMEEFLHEIEACGFRYRSFSV